MKAGANRTDIIAITKLAEAGESIEFISGSLQIDQETIKNFMPNKNPSKSKSGESKSKLADSFAG